MMAILDSMTSSFTKLVEFSTSALGFNLAQKHHSKTN